MITANETVPAIESIWRELAQNFTPAHNYKHLDAGQLLYCLAMLRALARDTLARVIFVGWADVDINAVAAETAAIVDEIDWPILERLRELCGSPVPAMHLLVCGLEQDAIFSEILVRLKTSRVGSEFLRLSGAKARPPTLANLMKALRVERITSYRPDRESDEDLKAFAIGEGWQIFKKLGQELKADLPGAPYPMSPFAKMLPIDAERSAQWELVNASMLHREFALLQEYFLPALAPLSQLTSIIANFVGRRIAKCA